MPLDHLLLKRDVDEGEESPKSERDNDCSKNYLINTTERVDFLLSLFFRLCGI